MFSHVADDRNEAAFTVHRYDRLSSGDRGSDGAGPCPPS